MKRGHNLRLPASFEQACDQASILDSPLVISATSRAHVTHRLSDICSSHTTAPPLGGTAASIVIESSCRDEKFVPSHLPTPRIEK